MFGNIRNWNEKRNKSIIISYHVILNNFLFFIFNNKLRYFLLNNNIKQSIYNLKITIKKNNITLCINCFYFILFNNIFKIL